MPLSVEAPAPQCPPCKRVRALILAATILSLSACSVLHREPPPVATPAPPLAAPLPPVPTPTPGPTHESLETATPSDLASRRALATHEALRALPPNELAQEIARLSALPPAPDTSIDLAMALLLTRNGGEQNRAISLVEPVARGTTAEAQPWQPIARLLLARLLELRRLEDLLDRRNQELRDSQRDVRQLNEKLEALKAIERSLAPRPNAASAAVTGAAASAVEAASSSGPPRAKAAPRKAP